VAVDRAALRVLVAPSIGDQRVAVQAQMDRTVQVKVWSNGSLVEAGECRFDERLDSDNSNTSQCEFNVSLTHDLTTLRFTLNATDVFDEKLHKQTSSLLWASPSSSTSSSLSNSSSSFAVQMVNEVREVGAVGYACTGVAAWLDA
jgi:hypothetical protein